MHQTTTPGLHIESSDEAERPGLPEFSCSWSDGGLDAAWVRVIGELDLATAPRLAQTLRAAVARARLTVLDLRRVSFMDSRSALLIASTSTRAAEHNRHLLVLRGPDHVHRLFALTDTADAVDVIALHRAEPPVQAPLQLAPDPPDPPEAHTARAAGRPDSAA